MNMAADHPVQPAPHCFMGRRCFKPGDVGGRPANPLLEEAGQRPVGIIQSPSPAVVPAVEEQQQIVGPVAQPVQQRPATAHRAIAFIAVRDQKAPAIGGDVNDLRDNLNLADPQAEIIPRHFIMIARHIDHPRSGPHLGQNGFQHLAVRR